MLISAKWPTTIKKGDAGYAVFGLQVNLQDLGKDIVVDGEFGLVTEEAVKSFQHSRRLVVDGVAGIRTQRSMAAMFMGPARQKYGLPNGILAGICNLESAFYLAASHFSTTTSVDLGWMQRHINPYPSSDGVYLNAMRGKVTFDYSAARLKDRHDQYLAYGKIDDLRAWDLAILAHNYPSAALSWAKGVAPSNEPADWVIAIGVPGVTTPLQWCNHYISLVRAWSV